MTNTCDRTTKRKSIALQNLIVLHKWFCTKGKCQIATKRINHCNTKSTQVYFTFRDSNIQICLYRKIILFCKKGWLVFFASPKCTCRYDLTLCETMMLNARVCVRQFVCVEDRKLVWNKIAPLQSVSIIHCSFPLLDISFTKKEKKSQPTFKFG